MPRSSMESAIVSPSDTGSVMSMDDHRTYRSTSVVSLEDPDVRLAAEALSGLGNSDPSHRTASQHDQAPILELFVDAHPWVGSTIASSMQAYTTTKSYSPRIVQYGANLIERNIGSPMANTVSELGKRTGVESGLRRYLGNGNRPAADHTEQHDEAGSSKRRRVMSDDMEVESNSGEAGAAEISGPRDSQEFLPAYRSSKPPSYREEVSPRGNERRIHRPQQNRSWSSQVILTTSGLGVALSESSLRSLKYCVGLLASATDHVATVMESLKLVLKEYDQDRESRQEDQSRRAKEIEAGVFRPGYEQRENEAAERLAHRIKQLCDDILHTMKTVVNSVSAYTGGALPDNARNVVKGQLLSIPQRWRWATEAANQQDQADGGESGVKPGREEESRKTAHRMIAFATEGLDMMAQVNGVVQITLNKAEEWLESFRKRERDHEMLDADDPRESID
ncbi:hypothetical protein BT93_L5499 [Corymbia citriodora subsp. variegata]|uniref:Transcription factor Opi1 n=1 Tax=Corymbia citriodora subsp. variegata TaxID=360336 RepID=A0A8T0CF20_CORYI|nr:hypothetical protein BT93_L5499 [Corymbia citriodora subsp. variegata]